MQLKVRLLSIALLLLCCLNCIFDFLGNWHGDLKLARGIERIFGVPNKEPSHGHCEVSSTAWPIQDQICLVLSKDVQYSNLHPVVRIASQYCEIINTNVQQKYYGRQWYAHNGVYIAGIAISIPRILEDAQLFWASKHLQIIDNMYYGFIWTWLVDQSGTLCADLDPMLFELHLTMKATIKGKRWLQASLKARSEAGD